MPLFDPQTTTLIQNWDRTMERPLKINRMTTDHTEDIQFKNFAGQLSKIVSGLVIETQKSEKNLPCFMLKENITYSALPLEKELVPFLEALSQINNKNLKLSNQIREHLDSIDIPVRLKLYIALQCPHCPDVVRTVMPLALHCKNISLHIIDGTLFPKTAQKDNVLSAPCLILDDDFRWTGSVTAQEITKMITDRDPSQLSAGTLKTILEEGDAAWITQAMTEKKKIFDAFFKLLLHETWSVRLGAMVIIEELAETDPGLAASICPVLVSLFDEKEIPVQGDILYALGVAGTLETRDWIQSRLQGFEHPDLIEAAEDALDTLKETHGR